LGKCQITKNWPEFQNPWTAGPTHTVLLFVFNIAKEIDVEEENMLRKRKGGKDTMADLIRGLRR